jgi:hypothetical protein
VKCPLCRAKLVLESKKYVCPHGDGVVTHPAEGVICIGLYCPSTGYWDSHGIYYPKDIEDYRSQYLRYYGAAWGSNSYKERRKEYLRRKYWWYRAASSLWSKVKTRRKGEK